MDLERDKSLSWLSISELPLCRITTGTLFYVALRSMWHLLTFLSIFGCDHCKTRSPFVIVVSRYFQLNQAEIFWWSKHQYVLHSFGIGATGFKEKTILRWWHLDVD